MLLLSSFNKSFAIFKEKEFSPLYIKKWYKANKNNLSQNFHL